MVDSRIKPRYCRREFRGLRLSNNNESILGLLIGHPAVLLVEEHAPVGNQGFGMTLIQVLITHSRHRVLLGLVHHLLFIVVILVLLCCLLSIIRINAVLVIIVIILIIILVIVGSKQ